MKYADFIEKKRHGSLDFPIQYYYADENIPYYVMTAHWHNEFEIIRVTSGSLKVFLNSTPYILGAGDILLISGRTLHRAEPKNCIYECVVFDFNMLSRERNDIASKYISPICEGTAVAEPPLCREKDELYCALNSLFELMKSKELYFELNIYSTLFKILSLLYSQGKLINKAATSGGHRYETISNLIDWIEKNFLKPITLAELAKISGLSSKYLCRTFKEYTSKPIVKYINDLRVENACYEMSVNKKNVTQAAFDSGFNNLSYFCKIFKSAKGITPTEYVKRVKL